jgi:site-specific DNA-methyltransferase (adenine-specific)
MRLIHGDCLEIMKTLEPGSVDMVLTDPPYGTTACKWDSVIPFKPMWDCINRLVKKNAAIVMMASQPFTSALVMSNAEMFKYSWVWDKSKATGHLNAKKRPLVKHEDVCVFCKTQTVYNPQGLIKKESPTINKGSRGRKSSRGAGGDCYGISTRDAIQTHTGYPKSVLPTTVVMRPIHPTQKPVALMEYLIKTYTNEGDTVLDFTMGSGTTGVACANTGRDFIGIELDAGYFEIARQRVNAALES